MSAERSEGVPTIIDYDSEGEAYERLAPVKLTPEQAREEIERVEKMPLFMEYDHEGEQIAELDAIKALQAEETPEERAETFKDSGNEAFKRGKVRYGDALRYYDLGLDVGCTNNTLNSLLWANKGQVHLSLENYGKCISCCKAAIQLDRKNLKAYFRCAKAYMGLGKFEECIEFCRKGLFQCPKLDAKKPFRSLLAKAKEKMEALEKKQEEYKKAAEEKESLQLLFLEACKLRQLKYKNTGKTSYQLLAQKYDYDNHYDAANHELHWSVLILYSRDSMSDFVRDWNESVEIWDQLAMILPATKEIEGEGVDGEQKRDVVQFPAWDRNQEYYLDNVNVYIENAQGEKILIQDMHRSLSEVLSLLAKSIDTLPVLHIEVKGFNSDDSR
eukprot:TRINITY_DN3850_c0_g1_i1.p1 TRINITY_DN3850_c0_g1~~TRINITY_DN3850_c0_g1_i1.p1  ORF type:complete len:386 (-),score=116.12 TRINITY_DN3850_c0_g1_i1:86-1243(-)